jgi:glycyl-tRNA synthetase beta chain
VSELLLEIGCEELPSSACREIVEQAPGLVATALDAAGLARDAITVWVAPRRFAVWVTGLAERQSGEAKSIAGPPADAAFDADGTPTKAAEGFARKQGVAVEDLVVREGRDGRKVVFAEVAGDSRELAELVPDITTRLVEGIRFGKTMRWGDGAGLRFSRPVRWIVAKVDEHTIPFELHGLISGDASRGHRFIGGPVTIADASGYRDTVRTVGVVADHEERRATITAFLDAAAAELGCTWSDPLGKLNEVVYLVEWPSPIVGRIGEDHMRLPPKVLVTAMQSHQRYFPLERPDGSLYPAFLGVSNGDPAHVNLITAGNEGVLSARLQDATFSVDKDLATGLTALDAKLDTIVFHQRLGTLAQKRDRLVAGVSHLAELVGVDPSEAVAAAQLAKVDQGAILVAEFSELQGYAGAHYARLAGHPEPVCRAVEDHYLPEGPDSPTPRNEAGALLACAEKVDSLVGAFAIDERPTSSKDPYGLRRAAAGLVRIALERGWDVTPRALFSASYRAFTGQGASVVIDEATTLDHLDAFLADRLTFHLDGDGVGAEAAAAAQGTDIGGVAATAGWASAIHQARETDGFWSAWEACNRCIRIAAKGPEANGTWAASGDPGEQALADALAIAEPAIEAARINRDFDAALAAGVDLAPAVDTFFNDVLVNAEDPAVRSRRYALIRETARVLGRIADFTAVTQGGAR